jgi:D-aminopeptidase
MTTNPQAHTPIEEAKQTGTLEVIDRIVHDIQNNLQVIRMEAELRLIDPNPQRELKCASNATRNIERLITEVRKCLLLP